MLFDSHSSAVRQKVRLEVKNAISEGIECKNKTCPHQLLVKELFISTLA